MGSRVSGGGVPSRMRWEEPGPLAGLATWGQPRGGKGHTETVGLRPPGGVGTVTVGSKQRAKLVPGLWSVGTGGAAPRGGGLVEDCRGKWCGDKVGPWSVGRGTVTGGVGSRIWDLAVRKQVAEHAGPGAAGPPKLAKAVGMGRAWGVGQERGTVTIRQGLTGPTGTHSMRRDAAKHTWEREQLGERRARKRRTRGLLRCVRRTCKGAGHNH